MFREIFGLLAANVAGVLLTGFVAWAALPASAAPEPAAARAASGNELKIAFDPPTPGVAFNGWSTSAGEVWRDAGDGSELRFSLPAGDYGMQITLFDSRQPQHADDRLAVSFNGQAIGTFQRGKAEGWVAWRLDIPRSAFAAGERQVLRFLRTGKAIAIREVLISDRLPPPAMGGLGRTGWNIYATRFMYSPTFEVAPLQGAQRYVLTVRAKSGSVEAQTRSAKSAIELARIWDSLPIASGYRAWIEAVDAKDQVVGRTRAFEFHKVAPFGGQYRKAKRSYTESGKACAEYVLKTLEPWARLEPGTAPAIEYPALFYSAYIRVLTTYATLDPASDKSRQALAIARKLGLQLIRTSTPSDWVYGNMPLSHKPGQYLQVSRTAMAGLAYLDLQAATGDREFLDAALKIAQTLKKTQLPDGRWHFRVDARTGKMIEDYTSDQAEAICFLDALARDHGQRELIPIVERATEWMLDNPAKTHHWQQQWDDVGLQPPYRNLEFYDTAFFAMHLLRYATPQNGYRQIAEDLFRYIEDQFVLWEDSYNPQFIAPGVQEQYLCYITIDWHAAHFIRLCMAMHQATGDAIYLKKAAAMADTLTAIQHPDGYFPTWMRQKPAKEPEAVGTIDYSGLWPNCMSYTAEVLIKLDRYLAQQKTGSVGR